MYGLGGGGGGLVTGLCVVLTSGTGKGTTGFGYEYPPDGGAGGIYGLGGGGGGTYGLGVGGGGGGGLVCGCCLTSTNGTLGLG